jgi:hypothetical protein
MLMPCDFPAIIILNAQVKEDGKYKGEIKQDVKIAILQRSNGILHRNINTKGI